MKRELKVLTVGFCTALGIGGFSRAWANHGHGEWGESFQSMDTDGDGKISSQEFTTAAQKKFEKVDANHDGKVTADEMAAAHSQMAGKEEKGEKGEKFRAEAMKMMDTNNDGVVTSDEHAAAAKKMFDKMDTDHDGYLTKAEFESGHNKMMHKASMKEGKEPGNKETKETK